MDRRCNPDEAMPSMGYQPYHAPTDGMPVRAVAAGGNDGACPRKRKVVLGLGGVAKSWLR